MTSANEFLYAIPTWVIALILLALSLGMINLGTRFGRKQAKASAAGAETQTKALRASLLGLLALLVGFSFSLAMARFEDRSDALVSEANAIGTAWLRSDLLDGADREALRSALADYAQSRMAAGSFDLSQAADYGSEAQKWETAFTTAWAIGSQAVRKLPNPATMAVASALNDMTDSFAANEAALNRHVPEYVLIMMLVTMLFLSWVVGHASGEDRGRTPVPMVLTIGLIVLLLALIMDLDRPRRGVIQVDQTPMVNTVTHILTEAGRVPAVN